MSAFDRKVIAGFAVALALLLAIEAVLYRSTANQAEMGRSVAQTHEVLDAIQELILRLTDAEAARRGFIMTGRDRYLDHYSNAVEKVSRIVANLGELTKDNPRHQHSCVALDPLIQQRFAIYAESIRAQVNGAGPDTQLKLTEKGQDVMEEIGNLIGTMDATERALRMTRQAAAEANFQKTKQIVMVGSSVGVTMLVLVFAQLIRENRRRQRAEAEIQNANEELEVRVTKRAAEVTEALAGYRRAEQEIKKLNEDLERRVVKRTAQLEAANEELEAFSYSVSHDLRAPLRHIGGFLGMLRQEASSTLNDKSRQYLGVIADSANQMSRLIDNLLAFSRMGRAEMKKTRVKMDDLVKDVLRDARRETAGREIEWKIGALPAVLGDRSMLQQVWVNLIANAVKYTRKRERARIYIHCTRNGETEWQFCAQDNGAGFDMQYVDKLFGVFQRLHRTEEFEGTGIGLANVRRIIQRHGGRTWAEGKVNEGASFYFTLPDPSAERREVLA